MKRKEQKKFGVILYKNTLGLLDKVTIWELKHVTEQPNWITDFTVNGSDRTNSATWLSFSIFNDIANQRQ